MKRKGVFICIEGLDASGKTTQAHILVNWLRRKGFKVKYTKEPSEGEIGQLIRRYILRRKNRVSSAIEALLFAADRLDHIKREVEPALKRGEIVVSDRYVYSSIAYQGGTGLDLGWIREINRFAIEPDLSVYIDVPPRVATSRLRRERSVMEKITIQRKVREVYLKLVEEGLMVRVDGNRSKSAVTKEIRDLISDLLSRRFPKEKNENRPRDQ